MAAITKTEGYWKMMAIMSSLVALIIVALVAKNVYDRQEASVKPAAVKPAAEITGKQLIISPRSRDELLAFMERETAIIGVSTVSISLKNNRRNVTFFQSENAGLQKTWDDNVATRTSLPKVFSDNPQFNSRIAKIINGNFECRRTEETMIATLYPAHKYAEIVCAISVPPSFDESSDFIGYINFFMTSIPTDSEKARLAKEAVTLSSTIYHRDISHD